MIPGWPSSDGTYGWYEIRPHRAANASCSSGVMSCSRKQSTWCSRNAACSVWNVASPSDARSTPVTVAPSAGSRRSICRVVVLMGCSSLHGEAEAAVRDDVALDLVRTDADGGVESLDDLVRE